MVYIGSFNQKSPFVYTSVFLFVWRYLKPLKLSETHCWTYTIQDIGSNLYVGFSLNFLSKTFLANLSRRLKWAFLIKKFSLSVVVVVVVVVVNFAHFHLLLQKHWANFNQTWPTASLGKGDSSLFKWRPPPFSKGR